MKKKFKNFITVSVYILLILFSLFLIRKNIMWGDNDISSFRGARVQTCNYYGIWLRPLFPDVRVTVRTDCMPI